MQYFPKFCSYKSFDYFLNTLKKRHFLDFYEIFNFNEKKNYFTEFLIGKFVKFLRIETPEVRKYFITFFPMNYEGKLVIK